MSRTPTQRDRIDELECALRDLVTRCDGAEGVRADGSNLCTIAAHVALGDFNEEEEQRDIAAIRRAFNEEYPT